MRILMLQHSPCIRNLKYTKVLRARGHFVGSFSLVENSRYIGVELEDLYDEVYTNRGISALFEYSKGYDLIHSHNADDSLSAIAITGKVPVIHDTHDTVTLYKAGNVEKQDVINEMVANRMAAGRIYVSRGMEDYIRGKCLLDESYSSFQMPNFALESSGPDNRGYMNVDEPVVVYNGSISVHAHRDFSSLLVRLAEDGIRVVVMPAMYNIDVHRRFYGCANLEFRMPVSPFDVVKEMAKEDYVGILPWLPSDDAWWVHVKTVNANKLFEYWAAGLPVVMPRIGDYASVIDNNPGVGAIFEDYDSLVDAIYKAKRNANRDAISGIVRTYADEVDDIIHYYERVINEYRG